MDHPAITIRGLSKRYRIGDPRPGSRTFREALTDAMTAPLRPLRSPAPAQAAEDASRVWALRDVSFDVDRGEVVGVIGRNGAGKSTLLKILSEITDPTAGEVRIRGRVASLLEVGTGFHPELSGRENVYLNGAILGLSRQEIRRRFDEIVAFSEVEPFIDTPVKRYSSGMYLRLAFSVAIHVRPSVLLVDEVLAVGDLSFVKKCMAAVRDLRSAGTTILVVSHNMWHVQTVCDRGVWLHDGRVAFVGSPSSTVARYRAELDHPHSAASPDASTGAEGRSLDLDLDPAIDPSNLSPASSLSVRFAFRTGLAETVTALVRVTGSDYTPLFTSYSQPWHQHPGDRVHGTVTIPRLALLPGDYQLWVAICGPALEDEKLAVASYPIRVSGPSEPDGRYALFHNEVHWRLPDSASV